MEVQTAYVAEHLGAALARQLSASLSTTLSHDMGAALPQVRGQQELIEVNGHLLWLAAHCMEFQCYCWTGIAALTLLIS